MSEPTKNEPLETDDLADTYTLKITGKKHDLVELYRTIGIGYQYRSNNGGMIPPDRRMIHELVHEIEDVLNVGQATEDLETRLESQDYLTGTELTVELEEIKE